MALNRFGMRGALQGLPPRCGRRIRPQRRPYRNPQVPSRQNPGKNQQYHVVFVEELWPKKHGPAAGRLGLQLAAANSGTSISKLPVKWNDILTAVPEPEEPLFHYTTDLIELRQKNRRVPMQTQRLTRLI